MQSDKIEKILNQLHTIKKKNEKLLKTNKIKRIKDTTKLSQKLQEEDNSIRYDKIQAVCNQLQRIFSYNDNEISALFMDLILRQKIKKYKKRNTTPKTKKKTSSKTGNNHRYNRTQKKTSPNANIGISSNKIIGKQYKKINTNIIHKHKQRLQNIDNNTCSDTEKNRSPSIHTNSGDKTVRCQNVFEGPVPPHIRNLIAKKIIAKKRSVNAENRSKLDSDYSMKHQSPRRQPKPQIQLPAMDHPHTIGYNYHI